MNPYVVSAQFAAYVWYEHQNPEKSEQEAVFFARQNWVSFLPCAHKGVGKLLTKIAEMNDDRELAAFLRTPDGRARVRALHHLAGGNHRVFGPQRLFENGERSPGVSFRFGVSPLGRQQLGQITHRNAHGRMLWREYCLSYRQGPA